MNRFLGLGLGLGLGVGLAFGLPLAGAGCGEQVHVQIKCVTTAAPAVECTVVQTAGTTEVEACWDFQATCANGAVVKAPRTCQRVHDGGTATATIPAAKLTGLEKCAGTTPPQASLSNLTIDGKPSEL